MLSITEKFRKAFFMSGSDAALFVCVAFEGLICYKYSINLIKLADN